MKLHLQFIKLVLYIFISSITYSSFAQNKCNCEITISRKEKIILNEKDSLSYFQVLNKYKKSESINCRYESLVLEFEYYYKQEKLDKAFSIIKEQEKALTKTDCKDHFKYNIYLNKALYYKERNDFEKLSEFAFKALKIAESLKDSKKEIKVLKEIVFLFTRMKENNKRWKYVRRAKKIILNQKNKNQIQSIIDYKWLAFEYENQYTKTEQETLIDSMFIFINRVKKDALKNVLNSEITQLYRGLEAYAYHKKELKNALNYIDSAIYYGKKIKGKKNLSGLYLSKSWDHFDLNQFDKATKWMDTAIYYDNDNDNDIIGHMMLLPQAAEIYDGAGEYKKAYKSLKNYSKLNDSILNLKRIKTVNELETKYKTQLKDAEIKTKQLQINKLIALIISIALIATIILFTIKTIQLRKVKLINLSLEKAVKKQLNLEQELSNVRDNLAQDFHDNLGNKLARLSFISKMITSDVTKIDQKFKSKINQITKDANSLYNGTRDFIFSLKSNSNCLEEVVTYLSDFGVEFYSKTNIKFILSKRISKRELPYYWSKQLIYIFKEAITNTLKHSKSNQVILKFELIEDILSIECIDKGIGISEIDLKSSNGLYNMKKRAQKIDGKLSIINTKNGVTVQFIGKLPK